MKTWLKSWQTPRFWAKASAAVVVDWVVSVSKAIRSPMASISRCSRSTTSSSPPAPASRAKAPSSADAVVRDVSRRKASGGKRSAAPRTTPWVSQVSTSPSTLSSSSETGPWIAAVWVMLPSASSPRLSCTSTSASAETRQRTTFWPSCERGISRSTCSADLAGGW